MAVLADPRGVSETAGVAVLVAITLLVILTLGISVFVGSDDGESEVEFEFVFSEQLAQLTIIYQDDKEFQAGNVYVDGPGGNYTWATYAEIPENESISNETTIFVRDGKPYNSEVGESDYIEIVHTPPDAEAEVIATWNTQAEGADEEDPIGDEPPDGPPDGPSR